ncbi:MAG: arginase family protein [Solirubrobacteraceae bacterium]|nr:arginase family protein [Solirubrobacteraceae bacterium]
MRDASRMLRYQYVSTGVIPFDHARVADLGDPDLELFGLETIVGQIEEHYRGLRAAGVVPITAGGDHSITYPILRALGDGRPLALVHLDAHYDTAPPMRGSAVHHGAPVLNAVNDGVVDPARSIQVGMRDPWAEVESMCHPEGLTTLTTDEVVALGPAAVAERIREVVGSGPVYVSFDVDVIDPTMAPGTGTPVPGGLLPHDALTILRGLRGLDVVGADVVETSPPWDPAGMTALTAAQAMFDLLCLAAEAHAARHG